MMTIRQYRQPSIFFALLGLLLLALATPSFAHEQHKKDKAEAAYTMRQDGANGTAHMANGAAEATMHGDEMAEHMEVDRSSLPFGQRLLDWFGRLHPLLVHFPIAFFPAALVAAIIGRRRPSFTAPVQFLVVAGGVFAPLTGAAGWIAGASADPEPILAYHRWLGVGIGTGGALLAYWAAKQPWEDRGSWMILALSGMTAAIAVQGFLGAAITHGMEHLMF